MRRQTSSGPEVVAVVASDLHLSARPPRCRAGEPDWYAAMGRMVGELRAACRRYRCPLIVAGDVFDVWNAPAKLINWAMVALPSPVYAVPGQHDLPYHDYSLAKWSAYWTLVEAGVIFNLEPGEPVEIEVKGSSIAMVGAPWGFELNPPSVEADIIVGVTHRYVWAGSAKYSTAKPEDEARQVFGRTKGYDVIIVGDNHQHFEVGNRPVVFNCGTAMKRTVADGAPCYGLLRSDATVETVAFDISKDSIAEADQGVSEGDEIDVEGLVDELEDLGTKPFDFRSAVERYIRDRNVDEGVARELRLAMENGHG